MKFVYVDESGDGGQSDVFVMAGLLIDAYRLRKYTATFDKMITEFLAKHPGAPKELKTKAFINGSGDWSKVDATERKNFLTEICDLAAECAKIFAVAFSFEGFKKGAGAAPAALSKSYWLSACMFVAGLVQQKMQREKKNKGLTVFIGDDNKREMQNFSDALHAADPWFDPIYQTGRMKSGKFVWDSLADDQRFDRIINSAFAIKSHHSSLIQVADAAAYIFRRHLELKTEKPAWEGEQEYYQGLVSKLEPNRQRLGRTPDGDCIKFYETVRHKEWRF
jgi:Protein of unknown function (DUF3800)